MSPQSFAHAYAALLASALVWGSSAAFGAPPSAAPEPLLNDAEVAVIFAALAVPFLVALALVMFVPFLLVRTTPVRVPLADRAFAAAVSAAPALYGVWLLTAPPLVWRYGDLGPAPHLSILAVLTGGVALCCVRSRRLGLPLNHYWLVLYAIFLAPFLTFWILTVVLDVAW